MRDVEESIMMNLVINALFGSSAFVFRGDDVQDFAV